MIRFNTNPARPGSLFGRSIAAPIAAVIVVCSAVNLAAQGRPPADTTIAAADRGRIVGAESAKLWMLVVSDFQCPFCKEWHDSTWTVIQREYVVTGKLRVAFVNFPLGQHANARPAAIEAMCAAAQGKFWPVADALFATQDRWKDLANPWPFYDGIAKSLRLEMASQRSCVTGGAVASLIDADRIRMARAGAQSTPTFFIGGSRLEGAVPIEQFRRAITAELEGKRP